MEEEKEEEPTTPVEPVEASTDEQDGAV